MPSSKAGEEQSLQPAWLGLGWKNTGKGRQVKEKKIFCLSGTDVGSGPSQAARLQEQACERLIRCQSWKPHSESLSKVKMDWSDGPWQQQKGRKWFALFHQEHKHPALMQPLSFPLPYHCTLMSSGSRDLIYHSDNWLTEYFWAPFPSATQNKFIFPSSWDIISARLSCTSYFLVRKGNNLSRCSFFTEKEVDMKGRATPSFFMEAHVSIQWYKFIYIRTNL